MAGLRIKISDGLERLFREMAMKRFGYGKGSLSRAAEEAIQNWVSNQLQMEKREFEGDPVKAIEGLLGDVDVDSVELQHLAGKIWVRKALANVSS
ncbi:hypothetical protein KEJ51_06920 [Candidatus Bathyarchaeota archaeon]|nr:hypothetical protein [Candidatus Bathyarchaeota archaeon]MBS7629918.1 hypothetical protein [Candidatus Bathyarchaeota archaeon]